MWTTEVLADYVTRLRPRDLTPGAVKMAKRCVLDLAGCAAAGFDSAAASAMRGLSGRLFTGGSATVWFSNGRLGPAAAAMLNSAAGSALDLDDGHRAAGGHPGASIIPAAIAAAEEAGASGEDLLASIAIGYEVGVRVASARDFSSLDTLSTGRWCGYGAAAAAAYLKRVSPKVLAQALSIAGVQAPGLSASGYSTVMGNNVKEGIPWSTFTGLTALYLAEQGFTGPTDILDHPSYYDAARIVEGLGKSFAVEQVYFKPYSCCRWIHSALDALFHLQKEHGIAPREIERIHVHTFSRALRLNNYCNPDSLEGAQYSLPFSLAVAALRGEGALRPMRSDCLGDPETIALAGKVRLHVEPELDRAFPARVPARVVLETARGRHEKLVEDPLGDPANPLQLAQLESKFRMLTAGFISTEVQDGFVDAVTCLEDRGLPRLLQLLSCRGRQ